MKITIGIDEVGRGPLAGPVVVCALALSQKIKKTKNHPPLRDSKKLSARQREEWSRIIQADKRIKYALARVYPKTIDRINISKAANLAATRACLRLCRKLKASDRTNVLLDGGLYLQSKTLVARDYTLNPRTIVRGDEKHLPIMLASIVAKVSRDRYMQKLHKKFPQYGFDMHKGYGTGAHYRALRRYGSCIIHRKSFVGNLV